jgi:glycosyltransferase involved in cell wall biosynthesis
VEIERGRDDTHAATRVGARQDLSARPRVMLFTDSFIHGGTERQVVATLRFLDRGKYDLLVGCLKKCGPFLSEVEAMGIPVTEFPITSLRRWSTFVRMRELARFLRRERVALVHTFDYYTDLFAIPAARLAGVPVVLGSLRDPLYDRNAGERAALALVCRLAHGIVANSTPEAGIAAGSRDNVVVIPNAIDPERYVVTEAREELRARLRLPPGLLIGVLAGLRPQKDHRTFLRAAAVVGKSEPRAQFVLIGDGQEREALEALARQLGIAERVVFAGDQKNVPEWLKALDIAVLSSGAECLPNAVLEAMACSLPVVATRVGGVPDAVVDGVTGWLVPPGDPAAMAEKILALLADPAARRSMGAAGRARIEQVFALARVKQKIEALYDRKLRERRPTARILHIGNYPPPVCGWSLHIKLVHESLLRGGADSRVMDIGPGRRIEGRDCLPVKGGFDYAWKLLTHRLRGFKFHVHLNGDSWKGYTLALAAVLLGRATGKPAGVSMQAGPSQMYFPRQRGFWRWAFRLLFTASGEIICDHEPVKAAIETYGIPGRKVHAISPFSVEYTEDDPAPLPAAVEDFLRGHEPRLFSYSMFRPEFTIEALWEAFGAVRKRYPQAGLLLAGPQDVPDDVRRSLRQMELESSVLMPGNLPHAQFLTAVQRSDVFVRTHLRDGVCASVLEALNLGVPVVAAEDGLRPPSVVTYAPGDGRDLAAKLESLLGDLPGARGRVQRPDLDSHLDREVDVMLSAGSQTLP